MLDYKVGSSLKNIVVKGAPSRTERPCSWFHSRPNSTTVLSKTNIGNL